MVVLYLEYKSLCYSKFVKNALLRNGPFFHAAFLVQRCTGTTAGLGYLEVNVICPGRFTSVCTTDQRIH